ncbi:MAG: hypothetical protein JXA99_03160 [Candidatus Lokiarchaeota archaeon]|nr:hypothetical protein [Candidatus Lokiarchaeota archaeon]
MRIKVLFYLILSISSLTSLNKDFEIAKNAKVLLNKGKYCESIEIMTDLIKRNPNPGFYITLVKAYIGNEDYDLALETINQAQGILREQDLINFDSSFNLYKIDILNQIDSLKYENSLNEINNIIKTKSISYLGKSILSLYFIRNINFSDADFLVEEEIENDSLDILMISIRSYSNLVQGNFVDFINDWDYIHQNFNIKNVYDLFEYSRTKNYINSYFLKANLENIENQLAASYYFYVDHKINEARDLLKKAQENDTSFEDYVNKLKISKRSKSIFVNILFKKN